MWNFRRTVFLLWGTSPWSSISVLTVRFFGLLTFKDKVTMLILTFNGYEKNVIFTDSLTTIRWYPPPWSTLPSTSLSSSFPPHGLRFFHDLLKLLQNSESVLAHAMVPRGRKSEELIFPFAPCNPWSSSVLPNTT